MISDILEEEGFDGELTSVFTTSEIEYRLNKSNYTTGDDWIDEIIGSLLLPDVKIINSPFARPRFSINPSVHSNLIVPQYCNQVSELNGFNEVWDLYKELGWGWLLECLRNIRSQELNQPVIEEDEWSPVELDYSDPNASEAIQKVADALEAIEEHNGLAATHPEERNSIVASLSEALKRFHDQHEMTYVYLKFSVVEPLKRASQRLAKSAAGEVVKGALQALREWVKDGLRGLFD